MSIKKEIEAAAIAKIKCPSCGQQPGEDCLTVSATDGNGGLSKHRFRCPTHQRRLSTFVATKVNFRPEGRTAHENERDPE